MYVVAETLAGLAEPALGANGTSLDAALGYLASPLALLLVSLGAIRWGRRGGPPTRWPGLGWAAAGLAAGVALKIGGDLLVSLEAAVLGRVPHGNNPLTMHPGSFSGAWALVCLMLAINVAAPVAEEFFFRGLLFGWLRTRLGLWSAVLVGGALFAAAHASPGLLLPLTLVGAGLCLLYERSGTLWTPVLAHAALNGLAMGAALLHP